MPNEKRLIDANALVDRFSKEECRTQTRRDFIAMVHYAPTVDAVEVVRCILCRAFKHFNSKSGKAYYWCDKNDIAVTPNDFCSHGERRDDNV